MPITDEQWGDAVKERLNPHALDHLTHLWQYFRKGERRYQATDTVRAVTGRNPQTLEEFFLANARSFGRGSIKQLGRLEGKLSYGLIYISPSNRRSQCRPKPSFQIHLVLGYVAWLLCFGVYVGPWLRSRGRVEAHRAIATLHSFRFFGLVFILPGVVGPNLPSSFAVFAAYGDLATGVLAMLALLTVRIRTSLLAVRGRFQSRGNDRHPP